MLEESECAYSHTQIHTYTHKPSIAQNTAGHKPKTSIKMKSFLCQMMSPSTWNRSKERNRSLRGRHPAQQIWLGTCRPWKSASVWDPDPLLARFLANTAWIQWEGSSSWVLTATWEKQAVLPCSASPWFRLGSCGCQGVNQHMGDGWGFPIPSTQTSAAKFTHSA